MTYPDIVLILFMFFQHQKKPTAKNKKDTGRVAWDLEGSVDSIGSLPKANKTLKLEKSETCWNEADIDPDAEFEKKLQNLSVDLTKEKV
jgi:hypothetical protein